MNQLDKLITKFCAPDEHSPRPVQYVEVQQVKKRQQRSQQMLLRLLEAIAQAERIAIAHNTPLPSKSYIMNCLGTSSSTLDNHPAALKAFNEARDRRLAALLQQKQQG